jgi:ATP-dependent Clp endopeptidase proteolytic subunit ClpP
LSDTPAPERTAEEIEAAVAKTLAEAAKANAEAAKANAEAREADAKARLADLDAVAKEKLRLWGDAHDIHYHIYRFNSDVGEASVNKCVEKLTEWHRLDPGCDIEVVFNSGGGDVIEGFVLFDHLRWLSSQGHKIITGCTGMAASMAGILVQAGDHRWMSAQSWYMIHRASFGAIGKTFEIEDKVKWIKRIEDRVIAIFVSRSTLKKATIERRWSRADWWLESDECLKLKLVDEVRGAHLPPAA